MTTIIVMVVIVSIAIIEYQKEVTRMSNTIDQTIITPAEVFNNIIAEDTRSNAISTAMHNHYYEFVLSPKALNRIHNLSYIESLEPETRSPHEVVHHHTEQLSDVIVNLAQSPYLDTNSYVAEIYRQIPANTTSFKIGLQTFYNTRIPCQGMLMGENAHQPVNDWCVNEQIYHRDTVWPPGLSTTCKPGTASEFVMLNSTVASYKRTMFKRTNVSCRHNTFYRLTKPPNRVCYAGHRYICKNRVI